MCRARLTTKSARAPRHGRNPARAVGANDRLRKPAELDIVARECGLAGWRAAVLVALLIAVALSILLLRSGRHGRSAIGNTTSYVRQAGMGADAAAGSTCAPGTDVLVVSRDRS